MKTSNLPELRYGKSSDCLTFGRFFQSYGASSWKRLHARVIRNAPSNKKVGLPARWTETEGFIGWTYWPRMSSHEEPIFNDQHQSWTWVGSLLIVACRRQRICVSTFAVGSVSRWIGSSRILSLDANLRRLTCAMAITIILLDLTSIAIGLPIWRHGVPRRLSLDIIKLISVKLPTALKQRTC